MSDRQQAGTFRVGDPKETMRLIRKEDHPPLTTHHPLPTPQGPGQSARMRPGRGRAQTHIKALTTLRGRARQAQGTDNPPTGQIEAGLDGGDSGWVLGRCAVE